LAAAFGPGGEVYYVVSDSGGMSQQGVWRLDGGSLTRVVDITDAGFELALGPTQPSIGVADDGTIQYLEPHPSLPDIFRLYRFDPRDGSAAIVANLDYAAVATSPFSFRAEAFSPSGELFVILGDSGFPSQQRVYRRNGGALELVADLTAQHRLQSAFLMTPPVATASSDGVVRVIDGDMTATSIVRVHAIDSSTGVAKVEAILDETVLCCSEFAAMGSAFPAFGPDDDLFLLSLGDGAAIEPQQSVFRLLLPEPDSALLQITAIVGLAACATRRGRANRSAVPEASPEKVSVRCSRPGW